MEIKRRIKKIMSDISNTTPIIKMKESWNDCMFEVNKQLNILTCMTEHNGYDGKPFTEEDEKLFTSACKEMLNTMEKININKYLHYKTFLNISI